MPVSSSTSKGRIGHQDLAACPVPDYMPHTLQALPTEPAASSHLWVPVVQVAYELQLCQLGPQSQPGVLAKGGPAWILILMAAIRQRTSVLTVPATWTSVNASFRQVSQLPAQQERTPRWKPKRFCKVI